MEVSLMANAIANPIHGQVSYVYGKADKQFGQTSGDGNFNLEQQAQIVADWTFGIQREGTEMTAKPQDPASPYYKYITGNIQPGFFS
jgi:hypothetical protein